MRPIHTLLALVGTDAVTAWVFPDGLEDGEYIVSLGSGRDDEHGTQAAQPTLLRRHSSPSSSFSSVPEHPQPQSQPRQIRRWRPKGRSRGRVMPFPFTNTTTTAGAGPTAPMTTTTIMSSSTQVTATETMTTSTGDTSSRHPTTTTTTTTTMSSPSHETTPSFSQTTTMTRTTTVTTTATTGDIWLSSLPSATVSHPPLPPGHPDNHHDEDPYDPYDDDDLVIHPHEEPTYYRDVPYFATPRNASKRLHLAQVPVRVTDFSCVRTRLPLPHDEVEEGFLSLRWFCARYLLSPRTMHLSVSRNGSTAAFVCNMAYPMGTNLDAVCPKDKRQSCRFDKEGRPVSFDVTRPKRNRWQDEPEAPPGVVFGAQMCSGKEFRDVQKRWLDKYCGLDVPGQVFVKGKNKWYGRAFRGMEICPDQKVDVFDRIPRWTGWPYWYEPPPALFREIWEPSPEADGDEHDRRPSA